MGEVNLAADNSVIQLDAKLVESVTKGYDLKNDDGVDCSMSNYSPQQYQGSLQPDDRQSLVLRLTNDSITSGDQFIPRVFEHRLRRR